MDLAHLLTDPTVPEVLCAAALPAWGLALAIGRPLLEGRNRDPWVDVQASRSARTPAPAATEDSVSR